MGGGQCGENRSREGRVERDFASVSLLLLFVVVVVVVAPRLVSRRGTKPSAQCIASVLIRSFNGGEERAAMPRGKRTKRMEKRAYARIRDEIRNFRLCDKSQIKIVSVLFRAKSRRSTLGSVIDNYK